MEKKKHTTLTTDFSFSRLRKRQHFFLLVAQAWIQEVLDVVALVQRNIQWYEIPWYREVLKAILLEFERMEASRFPESLVLLSRALVSNPDVISPLVYVSFFPTSISVQRLDKDLRN